jgi:signal transduction histidine kinase
MPAGPTDSLGTQLKMQIILICIALSFGIFVIDVTSLPRGVATGVSYVAVVLIALWMPKWQHTLIVAGAVSVLTLLGFFMSEPAGIPWMVVANRLLALLTIWVIAIGGSWLVHTKRKNSDEMLHEVEQEADRARSAKLRFLEASSNDIRHHLQTLMLLNGALNKTVADIKEREMVTRQAEALSQLSDLMNSLLDISELESGEVELNVTDIPIQKIFQSLQDEFEFQAKAKGLLLKFISQPEVAHSDGTLLARIIRLLISNAIRYTNQGEVTVSCVRESDRLRIKVEDTGIGIAPDQLARIFDEFYKIKNDPAGRNGGLGLGLSIVEHSASLLGTRIEVESEPGKGSSFSLLLPATV